jgi:hypothetical protein
MNGGEITSVKNLQINGNSVCKGLSYFHNRVTIESNLNVTKKINANEISLGDFILSSGGADTSYFRIQNSNTNLVEFGQNEIHLPGQNRITLKSNNKASLALGNYFRLESTDRDNFSVWGGESSNLSINKRGYIGINTTSQSCELEVSGRLKSADFANINSKIDNVTCGNLIVTGDLSIGENLELNEKKFIQFKRANLDSPSLSTRSIGTKVVLFPAISDKTTDYAIGVQQNAMWFNIPMNKDNFYWRFYASDKQVFSINGTGNVDIRGDLAIKGDLTVNGDLAIKGDLTVNGKSLDSEFDSGMYNTDTYSAHWFKIKNLVSVEIKIKGIGTPITFPLPVRGSSYNFLDEGIKELTPGEISITNTTTPLFKFSYWVT